MFTFANIFGSIVFGSIGMAAFVYGKKSGLVNPMLFGGALMAFPYFISTTWLLWAIGILLTGGIFVFPDQ